VCLLNPGRRIDLFADVLGVKLVRTSKTRKSGAMPRLSVEDRNGPRRVIPASEMGDSLWIPLEHGPRSLDQCTHRGQPFRRSCRSGPQSEVTVAGGQVQGGRDFWFVHTLILPTQ
jgi:hypothetical protein